MSLTTDFGLRRQDAKRAAHNKSMAIVNGIWFRAQFSFDRRCIEWCRANGISTGKNIVRHCPCCGADFLAVRDRRTCSSAHCIQEEIEHVARTLDTREPLE